MEEPGSRFLQYIAAGAATLNIAAGGAILGWTSPILPKLEEDNPIASDNPLLRPITKDEGSWIGSLFPLGIISGSLFSGYIAEWLGRKRGLLASTFPLLVGWILVGTAKDIYQMYIGRFILGIGFAIPVTIIPMYIGEIADPAIRGALGTFMELFTTLGIIFAYAIGPYVSYTTFWLLCSTLHIGFFICFMFMPESPYYFLSKGREAEAGESLSRLRGKSINAVHGELCEIQNEIDREFRMKASWIDIFKDKVNRKAILLTSTLVMGPALIGIDVVQFYVEDIFRSAGTENTSLSAVIIGIVQLFSLFLALLTVDKFGRKILFVISGTGCFVTLALLGTYFYLREIKFDLSSATWIPLATLILFMLMYSVGWGPLPSGILGEMFAQGVKSKATSICCLVNWSMSFLSTKFFANVRETYGIYTGFWIFAGFAVLGVIFVVTLFPETKGKTLIEIQEELSGRKRTTNDEEKSSKI